MRLDSKGFSSKLLFFAWCHLVHLHPNPICTSLGCLAIPRICMRLRSYGMLLLYFSNWHPTLMFVRLGAESLPL